MTERPDDLTQPISTDARSEQPPMEAAQPAVDAGQPAVGAAPPAASAPAPAKASWRSRVRSGRGLAVVALVVGLGVGAVGGAAATFAVTHDDGTGTVADGTGGFDRDGHGDFGPRGGHGGPPPGGQLPDGSQLPGGGQRGDGGGTTGQLPGGGAGTDGSTGETGTDANGSAQAT